MQNWKHKQSKNKIKTSILDIDGMNLNKINLTQKSTKQTNKLFFLGLRYQNKKQGENV